MNTKECDFDPWTHHFQVKHKKHIRHGKHGHCLVLERARKDLVMKKVMR